DLEAQSPIICMGGEHCVAGAARPEIKDALPIVAAVPFHPGSKCAHPANALRQANVLSRAGQVEHWPANRIGHGSPAALQSAVEKIAGIRRAAFKRVK